jgi:hypothetical protein
MSDDDIPPKQKLGKLFQPSKKVEKMISRSLDVVIATATTALLLVSMSLGAAELYDQVREPISASLAKQGKEVVRRTPPIVTAGIPG